MYLLFGTLASFPVAALWIYADILHRKKRTIEEEVWETERQLTYPDLEETAA